MIKKYQKTIILAVLLVSSVILCGAVYKKAKSIWQHFNNRLDYIASEIAGPSSDEWGVRGESAIKLSFDGYEVYLDTKGNGTAIELPSLNTEHEVSVAFTYSGAYEIVMDGIVIKPDTPLLYKVQRIAGDYYIPISVRNTVTNETKTYPIRTYPGFLPTYTVVGQSPYPGNYYLNPNLSSGGAIYKIDSNGNTVFYKLSYDASMWDFKQVNTPDGIRYIYCQKVPSQHTPKAFTTAVEYIILDEDYRELKRLRMKRSDKITDDYWPADHHDMLYISDSEYYLMAYVNRNVTNIPEDIPHKEKGTTVAATVLQGFKNGELFLNGTAVIILNYMVNPLSIMILRIPQKYRQTTSMLIPLI